MMIVILMGVSGAGKTTIGKLLAESLGWSFYDGDDFHPEANIEKMRSGVPLTDADREGWLTALQGLERSLERERRDAVISCSALKQVYRDRLQNSQTVCFVYLKGSYDLILGRLKQRRDHFMTSELLQSQFETMEEPRGVLTVDICQPPQAVVREIMRALKL
jgi:gluconokinase